MERTISDGKITVSNSEYVASNTNKNNPWAKFKLGKADDKSRHSQVTNEPEPESYQDPLLEIDASSNDM